MGRHEAEKRHLRISVGDHDRCGHLVPVVEDDPGRPAIGDGDVLYGGPGAQDRPMRRGRARQGLRNGAHAATHKPPQPTDPSGAPHTMVQEHIGRPGRAWAAMRANDAIGRQRGLDLVRLEALVEELLHALRQQFEEDGQVPIG